MYCILYLIFIYIILFRNCLSNSVIFIFRTLLEYQINVTFNYIYSMEICFKCIWDSSSVHHCDFHFFYNRIYHYVFILHCSEIRGIVLKTTSSYEISVKRCTQKKKVTLMPLIRICMPLFWNIRQLWRRCRKNTCCKTLFHGSEQQH